MGKKTPDIIDANFVNGELERVWRDSNDTKLSITRPVPSQVSFRSIINDKKTIFIINFDEFETMAAFEKLGVNNQKVYLEFEPRLPRSQTSVRLYNDKESIELKKIDSEDW